MLAVKIAVLYKLHVDILLTFAHQHARAMLCTSVRIHGLCKECMGIVSFQEVLILLHLNHLEGQPYFLNIAWPTDIRQAAPASTARKCHISMQCISMAQTKKFNHFPDIVSDCDSVARIIIVISASFMACTCYGDAAHKHAHTHTHTAHAHGSDEEIQPCSRYRQ